MAVEQQQAEAGVRRLMESNGAVIEDLVVVPKGRGVWLAMAQLAGEESERQGIFTDDQLSEVPQ